MKKYNKIFIILILIFIFTTVLISCKDKEEPQTLVLSKPTDITVNGNTLSWTSVTGATGYEVYLDGKKLEDAIENIKEIALTERKDYEIKIIAFAKDSNGNRVVSEPATLIYTKQDRLHTPVISIDADKISWNKVEGAKSYTFTVLSYTDNKELFESTSETSCEINFAETGIKEPGRYKINVVADAGDDHTLISSVAATKVYCITKKLEAPTINGLTLYNISWKNVSGRTAYKIQLFKDGVEEPIANYDANTSVTYSLSKLGFDGPGLYYVTVKAIGDVGEYPVYLDSDWSERNARYDIHYRPQITVEEAMNLSLVDNKTYLTIKLKDLYKLKNILVSLQTVTADSSSSLSPVPRQIAASDAKVTYTEVTNIANTDTNRVYYYKDYAITGDTTPKQDTQYFIKDGGSYTAVTFTEGQEFAAGVTYYVETYYPAVVEEYVKNVEPEIKYQDLDYYILDNGSYTLADTKEGLQDGVTYYLKVEKPLTKLDIEKVYYTADVEFEICLDEMFYTVNNEGQINYLKNDVAYYGKLYDISLSLIPSENKYILTRDLKYGEQFLSYRKPNIVTAGESFDVSPIKAFFNTPEEYNEFAQKYDGYYAVTALGELQYINKESDAKFVVMNDLDCDSYKWMPIPSFSGIIDGNNKKIKNLVFAPIDGVLNHALINNCTGTIKNLFVMDVATQFTPDAAAENLAIFANQLNMGGKIENCYVSGSIKFVNNAAALVGIVGTGATINNCQSYATIEANVRAAGLALTNYGTISNSYVIADVTAKGYSILARGEDVELEFEETEVFVYSNGEFKSLGKIKDGNLKNTNDEYYEIYYQKNINTVSAGGVLLENYGLIEKTFGVGEVFAESTQGAYAGGFTTYNYGQISKCYSGKNYSSDITKRNLIEARSSKEYTAVGGFAARNEGIIEYSYSTNKALAGNNFSGFVAINTNTIKYCYSTGGVGNQSADKKGAFVAENTASAQIIGCYYYKTNKSEIDDAFASEAATLKDLKDAFVAIEDGTVFTDTITSRITPVVIGMCYASDTSATIKPGVRLKNNVFVATIVEGKVTVQDLLEVTKYNSIGDLNTKGSALIIAEYEGMRIVINVTIN